MLAFPYYTTSRVCRIYEERGELFHFIDCPVICFQDLGSESEQRETMFMGTRTKVMQTIIQERSDARGNITFFSSNNSITDSDTLELYGDRIVSRLKKMCNYFELKGKDRRTNDVKGI
jgi:DNA replication protein DnaC